MFLTLSILAVFITFAYILWPFVKKNNKQEEAIELDRTENGRDLQVTMNSVLGELKDIEFDYEIGKLTEEDFTELKSHYRHKAVELIKEIEYNRNGESDKNSNELANSTFTSKNGNHTTCPICGSTCKLEDKYCWHCGNKLNQESGKV